MAIFLLSVLGVGAAHSTPQAPGPDARQAHAFVLSGQIAKLNIFSRKMGETRWHFQVTKVESSSHSPALEAKLNANGGDFATVLEDPERLFSCQGSFGISLVGKSCKVHLTEAMQVSRVEVVRDAPEMEEAKPFPDKGRNSKANPLSKPSGTP